MSKIFQKKFKSLDTYLQQYFITLMVKSLFGVKFYVGQGVVFSKGWSKHGLGLLSWGGGVGLVDFYSFLLLSGLDPKTKYNEARCYNKIVKY